MKRFLLLFLLLFSGWVVQAQDNNYEHILSYDVDVTVNKDRSIDVVEKINVRARGYNIQRGIYREIPIALRDDDGTKHVYDIEFKKVLRDGSPEPYHTEGGHHIKTIYIGDAEVYLENGDYEYTIAYTMSDQVRFFDAYDELYWNVTGNFWQFDIAKVTATVNLPDGAEISQFNAYTGGYGDEGKDAEIKKMSGNKIVFTTTRKLSSFQGLTIGVGWNKGIVAPLTEEELNARAMKKYKGAIYGWVGAAIIFLYLLWAWKKVGVDPKGGAIMPRFEPPMGFSPAACRYVLRMGFDNKSFASALVSMAVKGVVKIDNEKKDYTLHKVSDDTSKLSGGEKKIVKQLFSRDNKLKVDNANHSRFSSAITALESMLKYEFRNANFAKNGTWMVPAILATVAVFVMTLVMTAYDESIMVPLLFGMIIMLFVVLLTAFGIRAIRRSSGWKTVVTSFASFLPIVIFVVVPFNLIISLEVVAVSTVMVYVPYLALYLVIVALIALFFYLIQAPTVMGRKVMDEIEGLKMYMKVAEEKRYNMFNPPERTPELFEKLLPYAIALDVENEWGEQFESILTKAMENNEYNPTWYTGDRYVFMHTASLTSSLGRSFSSSISSASVSPQSSSSSGSSFSGGGFSGGGGGGGGGGGW